MISIMVLCHSPVPTPTLHSAPPSQTSSVGRPLKLTLCCWWTDHGVSAAWTLRPSETSSAAWWACLILGPTKSRSVGVGYFYHRFLLEKKKPDLICDIAFYLFQVWPSTAATQRLSGISMPTRPASRCWTLLPICPTKAGTPWQVSTAAVGQQKEWSSPSFRLLSLKSTFGGSDTPCHFVCDASCRTGFELHLRDQLQAQCWDASRLTQDRRPDHRWKVAGRHYCQLTEPAGQWHRALRHWWVQLDPWHLTSDTWSWALTWFLH